MERSLIYRQIHPHNENPRPSTWPLVSTNQDVRLALIASFGAGGITKVGYHTQYESHVKSDKSEHTPYDTQAEQYAARIIRNHEPDAVIMGEEISPDEDISGQTGWVMDGIDGTTNFARRIPICNFTLAKVVEGQTRVGAVYDFLNGDIYYAAKGQGAFRNGLPIEVIDRPFGECVISFDPMRDLNRGKWEHEKEQIDAVWGSMKEITEKSGRFHREIQSGGLEYSWIADGKLDAYVGSWTNPWDSSGGVLILREAGGVATDIYGNDWEPSFRGVIAGTKQVHKEVLKIVQSHFAPLN